MKWKYILVKKSNKINSEIGFLYGSSDNSQKTDYVTSPNQNVTRKIAGFDLDQTLIDTKSGRTFPKDSDDWKWTNNNVKAVLSDLIAKRYEIVIVTNQLGIKSSEQAMQEFKTKIEHIEADLKTDPTISFEIYCAPHRDIHRKPYPTFFKNINIDLDASFFCGDGAGRQQDHTSADIKFAYNSAIKFMTPEQLFLNDNRSIGFVTYPIQPYTSENVLNKQYIYKIPDGDAPELILMVGFPASGKSTIARSIKKTLEQIDRLMKIISLDDIGSKPKMIKIINETAAHGISMIIDNTNMDTNTRNELINLVKKINNKYFVRIVHVTTSLHRCIHNNNYRYLVNYMNSKYVPEFVYRMMAKKFIKPTESENSKINQIDRVEGGIPYDRKYCYYFY